MSSSLLSTVRSRTSQGSAFLAAGPVGRLMRWVRDGPLIHSYYALGASAFLLFAIGAMMVLSASAVESISADQSAFGLFVRQLLFGGIGIVVMLALSLVRPQFYRKLAFPAFALSCLALFAVLFIGVEVNGNRNWLSLGGFTIQPSEMAKLGCALMLGIWLGDRAGRIRTVKEALWPSLLAVGIPVVLVMAGRDMGTTAIFLLIYAAALFFAGAPLRLFVGGFAAAAVLIGGFVVSAPHRMGRVTAWLTGECDPAAGCYQAMHGLSALATGGWWGVGLGQSRSKYSYVPEAHNDFIFAIIGEEFGLLGTLLILVLFGVMAVAMARVLLRSPSGFERIVTGSILAWLIGQAFVNIGMVTGVLPVIGVPLPFISYGGSSLLTSLAAVGVVMSFTRSPSLAAGALGRDRRAAAARAAERSAGPHDDRVPAAPGRRPAAAGRGSSPARTATQPIAEVLDIRSAREVRGRSSL